MINVILQFFELDLVNINVSAKFYQNTPNGLRVKSSLFSENVISQSFGLDLVNINVYAKVYQNIPLSSRDRAIFIFFQNLSLGNASANPK